MATGQDRSGSPLMLVLGGAIAVAVALWVLLRVLSALVFIAKVVIVLAAVAAVAAAFARSRIKRDRR